MSVAVTETTTLTQLAEEINQKHYEAEASLTAGLIHAVRAGEFLIQAEAQCEPEDWLGWIEENFSGDTRAAQGYIRLAKRLNEVAQNTKRANEASELTLREALQTITVSRDV